MLHIALMGDSILDNAAYTGGEPAVVDHLQMLLGDTGSATLLALDGALTAGIREQIPYVPPGTTHLVISGGGNDALQHEWVLGQAVTTVAEALSLFVEPLRTFERDYYALAETVHDTGIPAWCCTIYHGRFAPPVADIIPVAVGLFNDVIGRVSHEFGFGIVDLRRVCTDPVDYANEIEPSGTGGEKIARAILRAFR